MNRQLPAPALSDYHTFPPHLFLAWGTIEQISKRDYPLAMRLAAAWGKALAEWDMGAQ